MSRSRNELLITKLFCPRRLLPPVCPLDEEKLMCGSVPVAEDMFWSNSFRSCEFDVDLCYIYTYTLLCYARMQLLVC